MKKKLVILIMATSMMLAGCGALGSNITDSGESAASSEVATETSTEAEESQQLTADELDELTAMANEPENMWVISQSFNSYDDIKSIIESISEDEIPTGKYKCVSGTKEGNLYTVRIEVVEGDNWADLVFPPRVLTFTKDGDNIQYISNEFDWADGCVKEKSFDEVLSQYEDPTSVYVYENVPESDGCAFIYVVNNNQVIDRISTIILGEDYDVCIESVDAISVYDVDKNDKDDFIIIGTDAEGNSHVLLALYDDDYVVCFTIDSQLSKEIEDSVSEYTVAAVKEALEKM